MPTITESQIPVLRCTNINYANPTNPTQPCPYYCYNAHTIAPYKHRCIVNSPHGMKIISAQYNESSHTPSYCPYVTEKDAAISRGTAIARKIGQKEKQLEKAKATVDKLSAEIPQLYEELRAHLQKAYDADKAEKEQKEKMEENNEIND